MYSWLDEIIAEQAAYYGCSVESFGKLMSDAAEVQEQIERGELNEKGGSLDDED